jgi:hypothetical protein
MNNNSIRNNHLGKPVTPHVQNQMNTSMYNNFQAAFTPNTPLIDAPDYVNRKQVLHDNLSEKLFSERVVEYRAIISSADRDKSKFPSPFKMQVSFGNTNVYPNLYESLTNVKYVTLNNVWVPRTLVVDTTKIDIPNKIYDILPIGSPMNGFPIIPPDTSHPWDNMGLKPYLILKVKELDDKHLMGTSEIYQRDTFMIVPDQRVGDMYIFKPKRSTIVYPNSLLKNISLFTLNLLNEKGKELNIVNDKGISIIGQNIREDIPYDFNKYVAKYGENKSVCYTDESMQVIYDFTFGVIENELNTTTTYNKI